ncbi:MAG: sodium ion-translocating decarboxylase subunit beta [Trichococcus flocculiformis]|jgi:sodium ion-translocating decarboxylase beta subunit|uniref:Sodium ion-translocating decarboxylase subunit beta n=2 Tax=root TaxID=1 RepID=A0A847D1U9_9LACT|nr:MULTISPECIES: sodium ion-translocating decarboxylase subunit beta [Trichococcus]NLD30680.1 sodium ion-translocating decarboxylase subunit beta [Trichococcus flocculiformis]CZR03209.1 na+-transporting methylmalonyl-coa/oxaloacetate decarboxylase beta subunit [Trichococcus sp. ES5]SHF72983.1 sodium ion-translocating decarboxylase, beta subunit [Trichococcus flocculiformis]
MIQALTDLIRMSGLAHLTYKEIIMIIIACIFLYLAIKKGYEPYLLIPIAFGILLVNLPLAGLMTPPTESEPGGLIYYLYQGTNLGIYPPLIFLCLGAATDFGPLIANPKTLLLGGAAQFGIFAAFFGALALGMTPQEAASVGIIGGADGPTAIYLTTKLANHLLSVIALAAYSYMALVPLIQPPIMRLLTTEKERQTVMKQMRAVSKNERILFPIVTTIFVSLVVPSATALVGMLMLGNLIRESGQVPKLTETLQNAMMYIVTILLGVTVGAKANGELFLSLTTIKIIVLGLFAFSIGTAAGVLMGKLMYKLTNGKVNPLIGAAGVSAVPMAARVVQKEGIKYNPSNYLLMHAMGPNVAGVIGSAVAAGVLLAFFG